MSKSIYYDAVMKTPKVDNVVVLWHHGYYDGMLSGMCKVGDELFWFQCFDENEERNEDGEFVGGWYRKFRLFKLTPENLAEHERQHKLFQEHVGTHTDYVDYVSDVGNLKPREGWYKFYGIARTFPKICHDEKDVVGWFEW